MTDSIYVTPPKMPLLRPGSLLLVRDILVDRSLIPDVGGIYGWWFDEDLPGMPIEGTQTHGQYRLVYIGIAPKKLDASGKASKSTLRRRICCNHLGRRIAQSTLRRSLAAELGMGVFLNAAGKRAIALEEEVRLTAWLADHAALSFMIDPAPWQIEHRLLQRRDLVLPLNIAGAMHAYRHELQAKRRVLTAPAPSM